jgi:hypothetical protein
MKKYKQDVANFFGRDEEHPYQTNIVQSLKSRSDSVYYGDRNSLVYIRSVHNSYFTEDHEEVVVFDLVKRKNIAARLIKTMENIDVISLFMQEKIQSLDNHQK